MIAFPAPHPSRVHPHRKTSSALFFIHLLILTTATSLMADHYYSPLSIERTQGPLFLGMSLQPFLQTMKSKEEKEAKGQFKEERRFQVDPASLASEVQGVICDFYKERLFRIEMNYRPVSAGAAQEIKDKLLRQYGSPRSNTFQGVQILFWDDGKTRLIFQEDGEESLIGYSMTYLDDALFHQASRERVKRETDPISP